MPPAIHKKFSDHLTREIDKKAFYIHQKKRRLGILTHKLSELSTKKSPPLCFGTKNSFLQQYHLDQAGISSHEEWLEGFREKRSSQAFFLGSLDETAGNQTLQYDHVQKVLKLRLPNAAEFSLYGTHLSLEGLEFPEHLREEFFTTLGKPDPDARKHQKTNGPISYRLVRGLTRIPKCERMIFRRAFRSQNPKNRPIWNAARWV